MGEPSFSTAKVRVSRFDDYYGEAPKLDGVYFSIQADPDTAFRELQSGSIDFAMIPPSFAA